MIAQTFNPNPTTVYITNGYGFADAAKRNEYVDATWIEYTNEFGITNENLNAYWKLPAFYHL